LGLRRFFDCHAAELTFTSGALWRQRRKFRMKGLYN
jgi:hypothetical protein